uniref:Endonuclease, Uma2 family (Restriction endonuclease fold) n=1 Tax=Candidatus Kentrum sp. DK TaxID=2126562 RepID=A0A450TB82_9GAMM|nr:MAG: Endonuclease, Uma2 family (restriction endonuclease fold) [Candidatus Kentron sp. DK]VFJ63988.1 MAG: Endonuclease, Uma2 family (restriction endonuclease fold) [Candidatus Kentron sp. DK]
MNWQEVCGAPHLRNLPFKIELENSGKIIMSPVSVAHSLFQGEIAGMLREYGKKGKVFSECAIKTGKGVKVADVAWASGETCKIIRNEMRCSVAPELCIEVLSDSNTPEEIEEKKALYFEQGAVEVWLCGQEGEIEYFDGKGPMANSTLFPGFEKKIDW